MKTLWISLIAAALLTVSCGEEKTTQVEKTIAEDKVVSDPYVGTFVSEGFDSQKEGSDWVSVTISKTNDKLYYVRVRSRVDKKKATCTFTSEGTITEDGTLACTQGNIPLIIKSNPKGISIDKIGDIELNYFCSGGATLEGEYKRINTALPDNQVDKSNYSLFLSLQDINFQIEQQNDQVTITPSGLKVDNKPIINEIEGMVVGAEIDDLDANGSPEIYIYIRNPKTKHLELLAYQANNKKSMSQISVPDDFYKNDGNEEIAVVENRLIQRFPIKNGKTKQLQFKLTQGEVTPQLVCDKTVVY